MESGRGRADDPLTDWQPQRQRPAVAVGRQAQLGHAAGLGHSFPCGLINAEDRNRMKTERATDQGDGQFQHLLRLLGGVNLVGDLCDQFQMARAVTFLGKQLGVGDGRGCLIGQDHQLPHILLAEVVRLLALGGDDTQRAPGGDQRQKERRPGRSGALVGGASGQAIHLSLEVTHQQWPLGVVDPAH